MGRYELVNPLSLFHELDRSFGQFFDNNDRVISKDLNPITNVSESKDFFQLSIDVPGIRKDDIKVELKSNVLKISGERKSRIKNDDGEFNSLGKFERSFSLPKNINTETIEVIHSDGVLDVLLPKQVEVNDSKFLEIKTFDSQNIQN